VGGARTLVVCSDPSCATADSAEVDDVYSMDHQDDSEDSGVEGAVDEPDVDEFAGLNAAELERSLSEQSVTLAKGKDAASTIAAFLSSGAETDVRLIFCTYQSARRIGEAQYSQLLGPSRGDIDLALFDEAHKTAGRAGVFSTAMSDDGVRIAQRVFVTATPKENVRSRTGAETFSMDNETQYGTTWHRLPFGQAVRDGAILPYKIHFIVINDANGLHFTSTLADAKVQDNISAYSTIGRGRDIEQPTAKEAAIIAAIEHVMSEFKLCKGLSFHTTNSNAERFEHYARAIFKLKKISIEVDRIHGKMSAAERGDKLDEFKSHIGKIIMANARVLQEGGDVPAVDLAVLIDPKYSVVDIAQLCGPRWGSPRSFSYAHRMISK
jgi:predicted helicase